MSKFSLILALIFVFDIIDLVHVHDAKCLPVVLKSITAAMCHYWRCVFFLEIAIHYQNDNLTIHCIPYDQHN